MKSWQMKVKKLPKSWADDVQGLGVVRGNDARAELLDAAEEGFAVGGAHEAWRRVQLFLAALRL